MIISLHVGKRQSPHSKPQKNKSILTIFPAVSGPTPRSPSNSPAFNCKLSREGWFTGAKALAPAIAVRKRAIFMVNSRLYSRSNVVFPFFLVRNFLGQGSRDVETQ